MGWGLLFRIATVGAGLVLGATNARAYDPATDHTCVAYCGGGAPPVVAAPPPQAPLAGTAAMVRGEVYVIAPNGSRTPVALGGPVRSGDQIVTGPGGRLQIALLDETVFTLGPNSDMVIDEFVYDSHNDARSVTARILKGFFRFIVAHVARRDPASMRISLPSGAVGIRGTDFECSFEPDGSGDLKLYSGVVDFMPFDSNDTIALNPGEMLLFRNFTEIEGPFPIR